MPDWGSVSEINVGGRSPRPVQAPEKDRESRRRGLTHSLTSPRREPVNKPELPSRPQRNDADDLPRPRSVSPVRALAPPSMRGSSLAAKLERASTARASNAPANAVPAPPPPKTRARFSANLDSSSNSDKGDPDASGSKEGEHGANGKGGVGENGVRADRPPLEIETEQDETPVVVLPHAISISPASEKRTKSARQEKAAGAGMEVGTKSEDWGRGRDWGWVRESGIEDGQQSVPVESQLSPQNVNGNSAASVFGIEESQVKASYQYWVARKLSRSPNKSGPIEASKTRPKW